MFARHAFPMIAVTALLSAAPATATAETWSSLLTVAAQIKGLCESYDSADCTYAAQYQLPLDASSDLASELVPVTGAELDALLADSLFSVFAYHELEGAQRQDAVASTKALLADFRDETLTVYRAKPGYYALAKLNLTIEESCNVAGPAEMVYIRSSAAPGVLAIASDVCD